MLGRVLLAASLLLSASAVRAQEATGRAIEPDVVYGHKAGMALTFDVFPPTVESNRAGVIFVVSGGWFSRWSEPSTMVPLFQPLTSRGYTVFAVRHGSSPQFTVPEAVADMRHAVRFIRSSAERFLIDPERIGVYGGSAGGHLSLMLGTTADDGDDAASDTLAATSDRVQAVVALVPPTDLTVAIPGGSERLPAYDRFPGLEMDEETAATVSPLLHVTADDAPTLLIAGVKDDLVPIKHSRWIHAAFEKANVPTKLIEYPDSGHGLTPADMVKAVGEMTEWFDTYLLKK